MVQLNLLLKYVAAGNKAATYCHIGSGMSFVRQERAQNDL
jgi:hypothetical protein